MKKIKTKKISAIKKMSNGKKVAIGAGVAALGAGAFYLLGPNAKSHQKKVKALTEKMKKEIVGEVKKVKEMTPIIYQKAVDVISENYAKQYKLHEKDIKSFANKLKKEWKGVAKNVEKKLGGIEK